MLSYKELKKKAKLLELENKNIQITQNIDSQEELRLSGAYLLQEFNPISIIVLFIGIILAPFILPFIYVKKDEFSFFSYFKREILTFINQCLNYNSYKFIFHFDIDNQRWTITKRPFITVYQKGESFKEGEEHKEALEKILFLKHPLLEEKQKENLKEINERKERLANKNNSLYRLIDKAQKVMQQESENAVLEKILEKHASLSDSDKEEITSKVKEMIEKSQFVAKTKENRLAL